MTIDARHPGLDTLSSDHLRTLGRTGAAVLPVSLGGEGILRTTGRAREAVPVILEALRLGVRYCDTAPAYQQSQDYYGDAFRAAGQGAREGVFLASKTHARRRAPALRLLDESLRRLGTDHLDLWQMHDLRDFAELDVLFGQDGALAAAAEAKADGRIRFVGLTGHHDPAVLLEAMRRFPFDSVLVAVNPADPRRRPFISTVVAQARRLEMGVVGMKVLAAGQLLEAAEAPELIRYAASITDTVIIGCSTVDEVRANLSVARHFQSMSPEQRHALEQRIAPAADRYDFFKSQSPA
ncbi:MAG TPA: aldo/keto reductase [Polyangia bacterium]|jgi:aryl-alcohol dehydrogenase-like predicted oxidoreductase|nr:aldo/keto reductase [Polyangia bacterium]